MKKVLVICGATATGKTALAAQCAKALSSEVISADSQLVYKGLNVGTAKPAKDEMLGVPHRMIDIIEPEQSFSVSDYRAAAKPYIDELLAQDKTPVICGGTGFYINSLLFDYGYGGTAANMQIREKYERVLAENGKEYLFALLQNIDPETAQKLHPNDTKRVIRALEIYEASGRRKSEQSDGNVKNYNYLAVAVNYERDRLYSRIEKRVDQMFDDGLVDEVKGLLERGIGKNCQCMQAIGYKEVVEGLNNNDNQSTMRDIIKKNTRHYAKRQITFFKKLPQIRWLSPEDATAERVLELLDE